jgi:hypothetical protein
VNVSAAAKGKEDVAACPPQGPFVHPRKIIDSMVEAAIGSIRAKLIAYLGVALARTIQGRTYQSERRYGGPRTQTRVERRAQASCNYSAVFHSER